MKYTVEIEIELPRGKVIELFDNPANMPKWQEGLQSFEPISGQPGQVGAQSKLKFRMGKGEIEMIETITHRELPERFAGTYETKGVFNTVDNHFEIVHENLTRWISHNEFKFTGLMRIIAFFFKKAFVKQSLKYMQDFKTFSETGKSVQDE